MAEQKTFLQRLPVIGGLFENTTSQQDLSNDGFFIEPEEVAKIEQPFVQKVPGDTTEFGQLTDIKDVQVTSGTNFLSPFGMFQNSFKSHNDLIGQYRKVSELSYVSNAVEEIVNEAIVQDDEPKDPVWIAWNDKNDEISDQIRQKIQSEFNTVLDLLDFDEDGSDQFLQWYVDGRAVYQIVLNKRNLKEGIKKVKMMSPLQLTRIYDEKEQRYFWIYDNGKMKNEQGQDVVGRIPDELLVYVPSGTYFKDDGDKHVSISYLHKAIRDINRLDTLEDHLLIYRIVRCLHGDSKIWTTNGYKNIRDVRVGDKVYSYNKENKLAESTVTDFINNGTQQIWEIKSLHRTLKANSNHPILVKDTNTGKVDYIQVDKIIPKQHQFVMPTLSNGEQIPIKLDESRYEWFGKLTEEGKQYFKIIKRKTSILSMEREYEKIYGYSKGRIHQFLYGDGVKVKGIPFDIANSVCNFFNIPFNFVVCYPKQMFNIERINLPEYVDEEFARFFGFMVGGGAMPKTMHSVGFSCGMDENDNQFYKNILEKYSGRVTFNQEKRSKHKQLGSYTTNNFYFTHIMRDMGFTSSVYTKTIPRWLFKCSDSIKEAFIDGLMDADGHRRKSKYTNTETMEIELCNKEIVEGLKELCHQLGWNVSSKIRVRKIREHYLNDHLVKSGVSYNLYATKVKTGLYENIMSVKPTEEYSDVFDIRVDNEFHNFVADGCVVHNSPERRVFYIDSGNLPPAKAEEYLKQVIASWKSKKTYDETLGSTSVRSKTPSMLEDIFLLRRNGKGTEVTSLPGGAQLGDLNDLTYFWKRVAQALHVPYTRLNHDDQKAKVGQLSPTANEITAEEIKFNKFINKLRRRFSVLFYKLLHRQLVYKNIIKPEEWQSLKRKIKFVFQTDAMFTEAKRLQNLSQKLEVLDKAKDHMGTFFSRHGVMTKVLGLSEEEIIELEREIQEESSKFAKESPGPGMAPQG